MPEPQSRFGIGATPGKMALAAALTVVFVVVLIVQFGGTSETGEARRPKTAEGNPRPTPRPNRSAQTAQKSPSPPVRQLPTRTWPTLERAEVLRYDPFALPAAFSLHQPTVAASQGKHDDEAARRQKELKQKQARRDQIIARLQQEGVKAVFGGGSEATVAVVGTKTIRVGDKLEGFRVLAIGPNGVVLEQPPIE